MYPRRLTRTREGRRRRATLQSSTSEITIGNQSIRRAQGASLAAIVLAGAAASVHAHPPTPRPAAALCQAGSKSGAQKFSCADTQRGDAAGRRNRTGLGTQRECRVLHSAIVESEQAERRARTAMMESIQQDLFILRKRFRRMGC